MTRPSNSVRGPVGSTVLQQIAAKHHTSKNSQHGTSVLLAGVLIVHNNLWPQVAAVISDLICIGMEGRCSLTPMESCYGA